MITEIEEETTEVKLHESKINVFDELINYELKTDKRLDALTKRITSIEDGKHGSGSEMFDNRTLGLLLIITFAPILVEIVGALVQKCRSQS